MLPTVIVFAYLAVVLYIGIFAFRHRGAHEGAEQFFLAGRAVGPYVFLTSLFGTHMTAFAVLGSSGHAFANGIVTFGLMATAAGLITPVFLLVAGTRIWALGRRHGFITPVQMFRDRWECSHIGTVIFVVQAALLVPYIVIGVMGGGTALGAISQGAIPYWVGCAVVALVVMGYVVFGGMRGTALVNAVQTTMFLLVGTTAFLVIGYGMGGFGQTISDMLATPSQAPLLSRERISPLYFFSYMFIPFSAIAFPHIGIFCLTAKRLSHFKHTAIAYPLCLMAIWLPSTVLGVVANRATEVPAIELKLEARQMLATPGASLTPDQRQALRRQADGEDVVIQLLHYYAPVWLAGLLGAGIMAAVMSSDSQILALSTMFTEDVFEHYGGKRRFGEEAQVKLGRAFVILVTLVAYAIALWAPANIFSLATQYGFSGYAALSPMVFAALFWKRSTKWGALAVTLWAAGSVAATAVFQAVVPAPPPGQSLSVLGVASWDLIARTGTGTAVLGFAPVMPMVLVSVALMWVVSLVTRPPSAATIARYDV
ncbi:MAG: sodium:solute symporter family protein [Vicinamibacteria bacterium]|nr:sodium:solute symporter family protein [Vicinamibacteria bacterium]